VGNNSFYGYSQTFLAPVQETKTRIKLERPAEEEYISICSPASCSPYCCRTSPLLGFLLHIDCIKVLRNACPISIRALWNFVRCIQPSYSSFDSVHQIRSVAADIDPADLASLPRVMSSIIKLMQTLPLEIREMILEFAGPSLALSLITVMLDTLPLLKDKNAPAGKARCFELNCSRKIFAKFITVRGQPYLSDLSNKKGDGLHTLCVPARAESFVLSLDDLGIRGICFLAEGSRPTPTYAPWYMYTKLCVNTIIVKTNVRKSLERSSLH
jgi:hypothetical protein